VKKPGILGGRDAFRRKPFAAVAGALPLAAVLLAAPALAQTELAPVSSEGRVIVKFKAAALESARRSAHGAEATPSGAKTALRRALAGRMGMAPGSAFALGERTQAWRVGGISSEVLAERLARDPAVEYAVPDGMKHRLAVPNDPLYSSGGAAGPDVGQWYLRPADAVAPSAINAQTAWDTQRGDPSVRVGVLDTGVLFSHPDLLAVSAGGKLLPGYDMISSVSIAKDGNGRDSDASDPGDGGSGCDGDSSWHGTQVSGLVGALTDNNQGMAGVGQLTPIVPVRVLGCGGGLDSDILVAMRWAAGLHVDDSIPDNPNPVRVVNLSLGSTGPCTQAYRDVIDELAGVNVVVVAAAGNSAGHAVATPANCPGVVAVAALRHVGTKVGFSDLGPEITLGAPGGNCVNLSGSCLFPLLTTTNTGLVGPGANTFSDSLNPSTGTSFATPLVTGVAALMLSERPTLTVDEVRYRLQASARPFPTTGGASDTQACVAPSSTEQLECYCTHSTCGAGMLDAAAAVADLPATGSFLGSSLPAVLARIKQLNTASAGAVVNFDASSSVVAPGGHSIQAFAWTLVDGGGIVSSLTGGTAATAQATPSGNGRFTVGLTVTDDLARTSQTTLVVQVGPSTPASSGDGGGGGGAMDAAWLAALAAAAAVAGVLSRGRRRPRGTAPATCPAACP
jgi:serine protease